MVSMIDHAVSPSPPAIAQTTKVRAKMRMNRSMSPPLALRGRIAVRR